MIGARIAKLEKFFDIKKPKNMNPVAWMDKLYEMGRRASVFIPGIGRRKKK